MRITMLVLALLCAGVSAAQAPSAKYFGNVPLLDQEGRTTDLYSVMKGRTIVLHSFFATCTGVCPVMTRSINAIQQRFAGRSRLVA